MRAEEIVTQVLGELLDIDEESLTPDTDLTLLDEWDSVTALRVLLFLERDVEAQLNFERFAQAHTFGELVAVVADAAGLGAPS